MKGSRADRQTIRENIRRIAAIYSLPLSPPTFLPQAFLLTIQEEIPKNQEEIKRKYSLRRSNPDFLRLTMRRSRSAGGACLTVRFDSCYLVMHKLPCKQQTVEIIRVDLLPACLGSLDEKR